MLRTKDYVKLLNLDKENTKFNEKEFMKLFKQEFLERLEILEQARRAMCLEITFDIYKNLVNEMKTKFWAISNKKIGEPFSTDLWDKFHKSVIAVERFKRFPQSEKTNPYRF